MLGIPILVLVFFSQVAVGDLGTPHDINQMAPITIALAIMSSAFVSLGISVGFDRYYKVLKRLGATPLGRTRLICARMLSIFVLQLLQLMVLIPLAFLLGWEPSNGWIFAIAAMILATAAFGGAAMMIAGSLSGLGTLAVVNGVYMLLVVLGGVVVPAESLPGFMGKAVRVLPSAALVEVMRGALEQGRVIPGWAWISLIAWALCAPFLAIRWFRWE